jgi:hypothetical protein
MGGAKRKRVCICEACSMNNPAGIKVSRDVWATHNTTPDTWNHFPRIIPPPQHLLPSISASPPSRRRRISSPDPFSNEFFINDQDRSAPQGDDSPDEEDAPNDDDDLDDHEQRRIAEAAGKDLAELAEEAERDEEAVDAVEFGEAEAIEAAEEGIRLLQAEAEKMRHTREALREAAREIEGAGDFDEQVLRASTFEFISPWYCLSLLTNRLT